MKFGNKVGEWIETGKACSFQRTSYFVFIFFIKRNEIKSMYNDGSKS